MLVKIVTGFSNLGPPTLVVKKLLSLGEGLPLFSRSNTFGVGSRTGTIWAFGRQGHDHKQAFYHMPLAPTAHTAGISRFSCKTSHSSWCSPLFSRSKAFVSVILGRGLGFMCM